MRSLAYGSQVSKLNRLENIYKSSSPPPIT
nr:MAG TPA: hypothetical protein [Caudoviricetes sp.]